MESNAPTDAEAAIGYQSRKMKLHRSAIESLDLSRVAKWSPERVQDEIRKTVETSVKKSKDLPADIDRQVVVSDVLDETFGAGPLEAFMNDPSVTEILVNGPHEVYIERDGNLERTNIHFADDAHVVQIIQRIAARVGRRIDHSSAMVDARMPDGSRVNAIIPPLSLVGPVLSIRRFGVRHEVEDLLENGTMPLEVAQLLEAAVQSKLSILISGGTGGGKTTMLNCLSRYIPEGERLVTIEDSAELKLQRPHVVQLETRAAGIDGSGAVTARELVRNSLRMRPDRIIVGEVRGPEALDMLQAMNTGHEGSMTTVHANNARDALARLEMMVSMAKLDLPIDSIRLHIALGIRLIVQVERLKGGQRRLVGLSEVLRTKSGRYGVREIFRFRQTGEENGQAVGQFEFTGRVPKFLPLLEQSSRALPESHFAERVLSPPKPLVASAESSVSSGSSVVGISFEEASDG